jgi:hypothetical protein
MLKMRKFNSTKEYVRNFKQIMQNKANFKIGSLTQALL